MSAHKLYEPTALTAELWALAQAIIAYLIATVKRVKPLILYTGTKSCNFEERNTASTLI
jgi:hypothetical protein